MRIFRPNLTKRFLSAFVLLSLLCATVGGIFTVGVKLTVAAPNGTRLYVDPPEVTRDPGGLSFYLYVKIDNVTDLYTWAFSLRWELGLLEVTAVNEITTFFDGTFVVNTWSDHVDVGSSFTGQVPGVNGSGSLVRFTLRAIGTGNCTLAIENSELHDTTEPYEISHTVENGYFYTTLPVARFTYLPDPAQGPEYDGRPIVGEEVTFNATASYDPDQAYNGQTGRGILDYFWDFGDYNFNYTTSPVVTHTYSEHGIYDVTLTVTDDDYQQDSGTYPEAGLRIQLHSVSVINVTIVNEPPILQVGGKAYINVTALNQGSEPEYMNVTAYARWYPPNPENVWHQVNNTQFSYLWWNDFQQRWETRYSLQPDDNATATISWDTTGFYEGNYTIRVEITIVKKIGDYWVSYADLEQDQSDNEMIDGQITLTGAGVEIHNIAVYSAGISPANIEIDEWAYVNARIRNKSNVDENFNATITVRDPNSTVIKTWRFTNITLGVGEMKSLGDLQSLYLIEGSATLQEGSYNVTVTVWIVNPGTLEEISDEDPTDNALTKLIKIQMIPVASFTHSPQSPFVGEIVTFNAQGSYAPGANGGTIQKYKWTFADGSSFEANTPIATHVYNRSGSFTVTLEVTDDVGLIAQASLSPPLRVQAFHNIAVTDVAVSTEKATVGDLISINVTVENLGYFEETFNVTTFYDENEIGSEINKTLSIGGKITLTFSWDTENVVVGQYTIKAEASVVFGETDTSDNVRIGGTLTIEGISSNITITATSTYFKLGKNTTLSGSLDPKRTGENVTIWFKTEGGDWSILSRATTTTDGTYSYPWTPETAGSYMIYSSWVGDDFTQPCESETIVITVHEAATQALSDIFLYSTVGLGIALLGTLAYFIVFKKPKTA